MRRKQPSANEVYESPFALTILPGKSIGRSTGKSRKPAAAEDFAQPQAPLTPAQFAPPQAALAPANFAPPIAQAPLASAFAAPAAMQAPAAIAAHPVDYPTTPGFPPPPGYAGGQRVDDRAPADYAPHHGQPGQPGQPQPGQPGQPPTGYAPLNFLDDPNQAAAPKSSKRRTIALIAVPLVLALAAGGYFIAPKFLGSSKAAQPVSIVFPTKIGQLARATDAPTKAAIAASLPIVRNLHPALADVHLAGYGPSPQIEVIAGLLPTTVHVKTAAQQIGIIQAINAAQTKLTGAHPIKSIPQTDGSQLWCTTASPTAPAGLGCISVDKQAIVLTTVHPKTFAAGLSLTRAVLAQVERH
jgi:hypothetical protein